MTRLRTGLILLMSMPLFLSAPFARAERIIVDYPRWLKSTRSPACACILRAWRKFNPSWHKASLAPQPPQRVITSV